MEINAECRLLAGFRDSGCRACPSAGGWRSDNDKDTRPAKFLGGRAGGPFIQSSSPHSCFAASQQISLSRRFGIRL